MIPENSNRIYLALGSTDMRKAINGLSVLVSFELRRCNDAYQ